MDRNMKWKKGKHRISHLTNNINIDWNCKRGTNCRGGDDGQGKVDLLNDWNSLDIDVSESTIGVIEQGVSLDKEITMSKFWPSSWQIEEGYY